MHRPCMHTLPSHTPLHGQRAQALHSKRSSSCSSITAHQPSQPSSSSSLTMWCTGGWLHAWVHVRVDRQIPDKISQSSPICMLAQMWMRRSGRTKLNKVLSFMVENSFASAAERLETKLEQLAWCNATVWSHMHGSGCVHRDLKHHNGSCLTS